VQVEAQKEHPRTLLVSTPYALKALDAETIGGKPASAFQLATPAAKSGNNSAPALTEQANEIICASGTACQTASIPVFASNGGSAKVTNSIIGQSGNTINVTGAVNALGANGNVTAGGNVTATGNVVGNNLTAKNQVSAKSGSFSGTVTAGGGITSTNGTVSGAFGTFTGSVSASEFFANSNATAAIVGQSSADNGVFGSSSRDVDFQAAIFGQETGGTRQTIGVKGLTVSQLGAGVNGISVFGSNTGTGFFPTAGVWGDTGVSGSVGVLGTVDDANALSGTNNSQLRATLFLNNITSGGTSVLAAVGTANGGHCNIDTFGDLTCNGTLTGAAKNFKIDHPLDPANKYLVHASVESSEMMNIYTGNIVTDAQGEATVSLPGWFEALNTDFRYQLTVVGQFAQAIVGHEIENHQFEIKTSTPNVKVSWQVTGVRQDAYTKAHPLVVEQEKEQQVRGFYLHPQLYGAPVDKQIARALHPEMKPTKATAAKP
jgi:hypothetical protein